MSKLLAAITLAAAAAGLPVVASSQTFLDNFNSLTLDSNKVSTSGYLDCSGGNADPENLTMTVPSGSGNWAMINGYINNNPTWIGSGPTQTWAITSGIMATHAEQGGHAFISRSSFDRTKYLSAEARMSLDACTASGGCMAGLTLEGAESDYREISLWTYGNKPTLVRLGPCSFLALTDKYGTAVTVTEGSLNTLRIDYLGPDGGGWRYWLNGTQLYINSGNGPQNTEPSTFLKAPLAVNPHLGIYYTAPDTTYVEGRVDYAKVYALAKVNVASATASATASGSSASYAIDGNTSTYWAAGGPPTQWIELDLGATHTVRKLHVNPNQYPFSTTTTTNVYVGNSPHPTTLYGTFTGTTVDSQWSDFDLLEAGATGRYVRISTTSSASWVSWREIQVYE